MNLKKWEKDLIKLALFMIINFGILVPYFIKSSDRDLHFMGIVDLIVSVPLIYLCVMAIMNGEEI